MKHFIATAAAALLSIAASGQKANVWHTSKVQADALIGNGAYETYALVTEKNDGIIYRSDRDEVIVLIKKGIFDYDMEGEVAVLVGYYRNGELLNKTTRAWRKGQGGDTIISDAVEGLLIKNWLEGGGDIRIVAPRYARENLDMKVPHRK